MFEIIDVIDGYVFKNRLNKYVGIISKGNKTEKVFISNPGRLENLLIKNAKVYIKKVDSTKRKTKYDLLAVKTNKDVIVGIDSRLPNWLFEYLFEHKKIKDLVGFTLKKKEYRIGKSRIDYLFEKKNVKCLVELKICTLVKDKTLLFPDAVSARSSKHLLDLIKIKDQGYKTIVYFLGLRGDPEKFSPNAEVDPNFKEAFDKAMSESVDLIAVKSNVTFENNKLIFSEFNSIPIA